MTFIDTSRLPSISRRDFLQALGFVCVSRLSPLVARFTAIADELAALMRWCAYDAAPRFAAG